MYISFLIVRLDTAPTTFSNHTVRFFIPSILRLIFKRRLFFFFSPLLCLFLSFSLSFSL